MPESNADIRIAFRREERRMKRRLLDHCRRRGLSTAEPKRVFREAAAMRFEEILGAGENETSATSLRQRCRMAAREAYAAGEATLAREPDLALPYSPPGADSATLVDVSITLDALVVLIERDALRLSTSPRMRNVTSDTDAPVHYWKGAGVRIVESPWPRYSGSSVVVVTEHASHLSALFRDLRQIVGPAIDYRSKYELFGRSAEAANRWIEDYPETDRNDLLEHTVKEAQAVVEAWLETAITLERADSL